MPTIADLARAQQRVFPTHARVDRYYPAAASEEARGVLGRCLDRGEGPALLIGAPGTGKSMLLQVLAGDIGKNRPVVCLTSAQLCTRRALLQSILFELGQSYRQRDEGDLRLTLMDYLSSGDVRQTGMLLLVDEAQSLPIRLLEELRILGNVAHEGVPLVRLLLAGSQQLEETFTEPELEAFNQRIAARCYLAPLSHHDTAQLVRGHLAAAGVNPDQLFNAEALDAVYRATDGIARLVNQLCDRALVLAAERGDMQVGKQAVEVAWADLQQLPTPWNLPDTPEMADEAIATEDVVEFGPLSDDDGDSYEVGETSHFEQVAATPTARLHEPEVDVIDDDLVIESISEEQASPVAETISESVTSLVATSNEPTPVSESVVTPSRDELFGNDFEEEVVIDEFASLEQAIPANRPRVSSPCDAELTRLLSRVIETSDPSREVLPEPEAMPQPETVEPPTATTDSNPFAGFTVVEADSLDEEEQAIDPTELDDESEDELYDEITEMAEQAEQAAKPDVEITCMSDGEDTEDILVVEDEMSLPLHTNAAARADYRQLFKNLRYDA